MPRSLCVRTDCIQVVKDAVQKAVLPSQSQLAKEVGMSRTTVSKFLNGKPVDFLNFTELCVHLNLDYREISNLTENVTTQQITPHVFYDWGEAPDIEVHGHAWEKQQLKSWLSEKDGRCRIISITGLPWTGKTFLVAQVTRKIAHQFEFIIWRNIRNYKSPSCCLDDLLSLLGYSEHNEAISVSARIEKMISHLKQHRCLIILNRMELVMQPGEGLGNFELGHEEYSDILRRVGEQSHQSIFLLISREPIKFLSIYEGANRQVRQLPVKGLKVEEARHILEDKGAWGPLEKQDELIRRYGAHPTFVRIAAGQIKSLKKGNIKDFLAEEEMFTGKAPIVFNGIELQLDSLFERVSSTEVIVITWIALCIAPSSEHYLFKAIDYVSSVRIRSALLALSRRSLIKINNGCYQIHEYIREYLLLKLRKKTISDIESKRIGQNSHFNKYPLMIAQSEDSIRDQQYFLLANRIFERLYSTYGKQLEAKLTSFLENVQVTLQHSSGYAAANLLILLKENQRKCSGNADKLMLRAYNFSNLAIRRCDLRGIRLEDIDFSYTDLSESIFYEPFGGILSIVVSMDGKFLAGGDASHNVYVWEIQGSQFIFYRKYRGHTHWVRSVAISPDNRYLASGSEDNTVRVWDLSGGETVGVLRGYDRRIRSLAFSPMGKYLASAGDDSTVVLWSTQSWTRIGTYRGTFKERRFREITFDAVGKTLIAANQNGQIHIWNLEYDLTLQNPQIIQCGQALVRTIAIHPKGSILATGSDDGVVKLWSFPSGNLLAELSGKTNWVRKVIFSQCGSYLASSSEDGKIQVWNVVTRKRLSFFDQHNGRVWEIAFSPDGKKMFSGSDDQHIRLWDLETNECLTHLQGYTCKLRSVAFSPDGRQIAIGGDDQFIRIWDIESGYIHSLPGHKGRVWSVGFCQLFGKLHLISGSDDKKVKLWNLDTDECIKTFDGHESWVRTVSSNLTSRWVLSGGDDKLIRAFNLETFERRKFSEPHDDWVLGIAISPNGEKAVSVSDDSTVKVWDVETGKLLHVFKQHTSAVRAVAVSPDGRWTATGSKDKTVRLFDIEKYIEHSNSPLQDLQGHDGWVRCVTFHPSAAILASGGYDQKVILWDYETGKPFQVLRGHDEAVISVAFSPDGQTLATGSEDGTIKLWAVKTAKLVKTIRIPRPYEGLNITGASISRNQRTQLVELGAIDYSNR